MKQAPVTDSRTAALQRQPDDRSRSGAISLRPPPYGVELTDHRPEGSTIQNESAADLLILYGTSVSTRSLMGHGRLSAVQRQLGDSDKQRADLKAVTSLEIESYEKLASSNFSGVRKWLKRRSKQIDDILKLNATKRDTLAAMKSRWSNTIFDQPDFDPIRGPINKRTADELHDLLKADMADAQKIGNMGLTDQIENLGKSLNGYLEHKSVDDEREQFHRFDEAFLVPDVLKALADIGAEFRPADLKALVAQESGDLTNTTIAGIDVKKPGIHTNIKNEGDYVGIAQMDKDALDQAIIRGQQLKITVPSNAKNRDPRENPHEAILLAALYLSDVARQLHSKLPAPIPAGVEFKKFVLAAYNAGPEKVAKVVRKHLSAIPRNNSYKWNDIVADKAAMNLFKLVKNPKKPREVTEYVQRILQRAP